MDEMLFKRLLLAWEDDENIDELIRMGYFKKMNGRILQTELCREELGRFIDAKKALVYEAVKELGSAENMERVMEIAGIKDFITFVFVAEELVEEGKFVKDKVKNVVLKAGS
ncbi:MAG: hypothetical protein ACOX86_00915 [Pelotomaculaceae bacterium]|jgi:hypothetical protein|nr:hypothetical protein [Bacillota bacterium]HHU87057.1 hypothetical protein [Peptococcaceae bacterium]